MSDPFRSYLNSHSSDSEEESVEHRDNLGNQLGDLLGHQTILDGASSPEKEPFSTDLADLGRALFFEDKEKRLKRLYGARQGNQLGNTTTSHGNGILAGASLPCISSFQPHLGDAEPYRASVLSNSDHRVETWDNSWERSVPENCAIVEDILWDREEHGQFGREEEKKEQLIREQSTRERQEGEERELQEAENWPQQPEAITGQSHWLCEHYQRHCRVRFPCCTQFYPCHGCHNMSKACDNEEVKACHATHLKCSFCQEEQEIGEHSANCRKCGGKMSAYFCAICKHFTSVYKNPYHCEKCGICRIHQNKSFHCEVCNVCLDKRLEGNHKCCPDSDFDQFFSEDAFSGYQKLLCSHKVHRECANVAVTQNVIDLEEESVKHPDNLGNQLGDLLGHQTILDGASSPEKEPFSADLADLGRALFLEDKEKRLKRLYGARQGNQLGNTTTSHGNGVLAGASLPCISSFQPHLGDAEPSRASVLSNSDHRVETWDNSWERSVPENCAIVEDILWDREEHGQFGREEEKKEQLIREQSTRERQEREERELQEAENWPQQPEAITGRSHWLCEHYQRHCRVRFPCCTQFYPCHRCHNISKACDNEEAKACHATHLKCSFCQEEQEIGEHSANCRKCGGKMSAYFCAICKHFTSVYKNLYHCEKCGICRDHQNKSFHCEVCNVCLDKCLEGNHKCRPDSDYDQVFSEDAFSGCQILPCSHKAHRECANVAVTQNVIKDHNHGSCLCERCTSTREDEDKEVSLELPYAESSSSYSTQSQVDFDDNWAQPQTLSADASLESFTSSRCSNCSANSWIVPDTGEGIAPSFLLKHTQDEELSQSALSKLSILNDIPSKCISSSSIDPVTYVACESERAYPSFSDDCQDASYSHLDEGLESIFSVWSSGQCERQSVDEGSWAGAVRPHVGFPVHGAVGGVFNDPLAWGNAAFNGDCSTIVLEEEAGFDDDMFVWSSADGFDAVDVFNDTQVLTRELPSREASSVSDLNGNLQATGDDLPSRVSLHSQPQWDQDLPYVGARPRQVHYSTSASPNSQSQQDWNSLGARPREHQYSTRASLPSLPQQDEAVPVLTLGRQFPVTTDWLSPVARLQQAQYSYSSDEFDGGRGTEEDFEGGVTILFLLKHSQDKALRAWALHEQVLMEQDLKQLGTSIKREGKLVRKIRACEEEEDEELHEISSCTQEVRTAHKEPVHNCVNCNQIIDAQQQENHPCHPDICCICQEYVDAFIGCYEVPCGHKFHEECYLNMMVNNIETCPLCRRPF